MDRTLLKKNGSFEFYFWLLKGGIVSPWTFPVALFHLFQYRYGKRGLTGLHQRLFRYILKGLKQSVLEREADLFFQSNMDRLISKSVARHIDSNSCILSSSPSFLVSRIAAYFQIELYAGTEYEVDRQGCLSGIHQLVTGEEKLKIAKKWSQELSVFPENITAWSDSTDDLPILNWAGTVIAVRPSNALKKIAVKNKWQIWKED